mmetsp:Transcript_6924/g.17387  ORF Transcript_6924/g.17387 Transcript_6924/m.17387 type:complete len:119 (-) Transcript_6924:976-1332(-)
MITQRICVAVNGIGVEQEMVDADVLFAQWSFPTEGVAVRISAVEAMATNSFPVQSSPVHQCPVGRPTSPRFLPCRTDPPTRWHPCLRGINQSAPDYFVFLFVASLSKMEEHPPQNKTK